MFKKMTCGLTLLMAGFSSACFAESWIVENSEPRASIVIAENPPRTVRLAARELQTYIQKISGATLPIGTAPNSAYPVTIYVGRSAFTDKQGITDEGLDHEAYRIVSGPNWLVLLGQDSDFDPPEPWHRQWPSEPGPQQAWEEITGRKWMNPMVQLFRSENRATGIWLQDEGGSLNAVYAFLRKQGVRWYMPGELGEVVPHQPSIALTPIDKTVHPDFAARVLMWPGVAYMVADEEGVFHYRRLGLNAGHRISGVSPFWAHGLRLVIGHPEMKAAHPEYYALIGGERDNKEIKGIKNQLCLSAEGLIRETIDFARAVFDHYDEPMVDIWPTDGFRRCRCDLCPDPEVVSDSEYVWGFVDRVAREVYASHPDRLISSGSYAGYKFPPESIERFSPNLVVYLDSADMAEAWKPRLAPSRMIRNANQLRSLWYRNTRMPFPIVQPRRIARELQAFQGIALGEHSEVPRRGETSWQKPGVNHLNLYVLSCLFWDPDLDIDALLDEYYQMFYGPVAAKVQEAFELAEANIPARVVGLRSLRPADPAAKVRILELLYAARAEAGDSVYGKRIQILLDEIDTLETALEELAMHESGIDPRADALLVLARDLSTGETPETHEMRDLVTGDPAELKTTVTVVWDRNALVFSFRCEEPDMENLFITENVWSGDSVAVLLETSSGAYYQIEVNPDGVVFDAVRIARLDTGWSSLAKVQTFRESDAWGATLRIPVVGEVEGAGDPLHYVVGEKPTVDDPWYFNVGRTRMRGLEKRAYGLMSTGESFHDQNRFARLATVGEEE